MELPTHQLRQLRLKVTFMSREYDTALFARTQTDTGCAVIVGKKLPRRRNLLAPNRCGPSEDSSARDHRDQRVW